MDSKTINATYEHANNDVNKNSMINNVEENGGELQVLIPIITLLLRQKKWIVFGTGLSVVIGFLVAFFSEPIYIAQGIITPKQAEKGMGSNLLTQMGGLGGLVAAQIGLNSSSLDHIAIICKSHEMSELVIEKYNVLPRLFHKKYDFQKSEWIIRRDSTDIPTLQDGVKKISEKVISIQPDLKKSILIIRADSYDSVFSAELVNYYIRELESKLKSDVIRDANAKRFYLESQMKGTADPWMIQKLQTLIGIEVEKSMMIAGNTIDILESPVVPFEKSKPQRLFIISVSFAVGFFAMISLIVGLSYFKAVYKLIQS